MLFTGCLAPTSDTNSLLQESDQIETSVADLNSYTLKEGATILTMACWVQSEKEARLVDSYNRTHNDYQIKIISFFDGNPDHYEAALLHMQTELLTGDKPDLYSLNSMDVVSIEKAGLLMNLYPLMDADATFQRDDYFMNVWDLYDVDGALYEFIPAFAVRGLVGPKSLVGNRTGWTYEEMNHFIEQAESKNKKATGPVSLYYMIQGPCSAYIDVQDGTCEFDSESFRQWMNLTKYFENAEQNGDALLDEENLVLGVNQYLIHKAYYQDTPVFTGFPSIDGAGPFAAAIDSFAISSATKYPEICWEFLCSFMNDELSSEFMGIPMLKSTLERQLQLAMLDPSDENFPVQSDEYNMQSLTQEDVDYLLDMIDSIDHIKFRYDGVTNIMIEEMELWLNGSQTTEQTIEYLQNRVGIYLAEQS